MSIVTNTDALRVLLNKANSLPSGSGGASSGPAYGKAIFFGDSLAVGVGNNDYSYVDILAESGLFESVVKTAQGGTTIGPYSPHGSEADEYCLIRQIERYASDILAADIVFLQFGGNDSIAVMQNGYPLGVAEDTEDTETVCGYAKKALNAIRALNPNARLIYLDPFDIFGETDQDYKDFALLARATLIKVVYEFRCGVIDMYSGFNGQLYVVDDAHPTTEGHKKIAENVAANIFTNYHLPKLFRQIYFETIDMTTYTADLSLASAIAMAKSGIELFGVSYIPGSSGVLRFNVAFVADSFIRFWGVNLDGTSHVYVILDWTQGGIIPNYKFVQ